MMPDEERERREIMSTMGERDKRYAMELNAVKESITVAMSAAEKAVNAALAAAEKAVAKAETATDKRFEGVNEFRAQLADQQRTFIPRLEVDVLTKGINVRITAEVQGMNDRFGSEFNNLQGRIKALEDHQKDQVGKEAGLIQGWGKAVGIVSLVIAIATAVIMLTRKGP